MAETARDAQNLNRLHQFSVQFFHLLDKGGRFGRAFLAFILGGGLSFAFAPYNMFPVAFLVLPIALRYVAHAEKGADAFGSGWWFGLGFFAVGLNWIGYSFTQQDQVPAALAPVAVFFLAASMAVYWGLAFWLTWRLGQRGLPRLFLFASAWTMFEIMRGFLFTGFPWNPLGAMWSNWLPVAQSAYYLGTYGLTFLTVLAAAGLSLFFEKGKSLRASIAVALVCLLVFPVLAFLGYQRLSDNLTRYHLSVTMRLVQANVPQHEKWLSYLIDDHFEKHSQLSRKNGLSGKAEGVRLLIWPETAVQRESFDREASLSRWRVSRLLDFGSYAITGAPRYEEDEHGLRYYNSLMAINSKGELYARYDKHHLVPFGEYLPFTGLLKALGLKQLAEGGAFAAGAGPKTVSLPGIPSFSPLICYEAIFPGAVIDEANRPGWMLNISNDAWFGLTDGPHQHLALSRMRAIEEGLPLVRSTSTGISAVIDPYGRTVSSLGLNRRGILDSPLPVAIDAPLLPSSLRVLMALFLSAGIILYYLLGALRRDGFIRPSRH